MPYPAPRAESGGYDAGSRKARLSELISELMS